MVFKNISKSLTDSGNIKIWKYSLLSILILGLALLIVFRSLSQDEGVFLTIGQSVKHGYVPYRDLFDHKPPGIYIYYAIQNMLFGNKIELYKISYILFYFIYIILLGKVSNILKISRFWTVLFFLLLSLIFEGEYMLAEPYIGFLLLMAYYIIFKNNNAISLFAAGALLGLAILFKQSAIISAIILIIYCFVKNKGKKTLIIFGGLIIPILAIVAYLLTNDAYYEAIQQIIVYNLIYYPNEILTKVLSFISLKFLITAPIWLLELFMIWKIITDKKFTKNKFILVVLATLPATIFLVRHYPHYWLQIIPFSAILASMYISKIGFAGKKILLISPQKALLIFAIALLVAKVTNTLTYTYPRFVAENKLKIFIKKLPKTNKIYAENNFTSQYFYQNVLPNSKYLYITEINDWSEQSQQITINCMNSIDTVIWPYNYNQAYAKNLQQYILSNYKEIYSDETLGVIVLKK